MSTNHDVFGTVWRCAHVGVLHGGFVADAIVWLSEAVAAEEFWRKSGYELLASFQSSCVQHWAIYWVWVDGGLVWFVLRIVLEQ